MSSKYVRNFSCFKFNLCNPSIILEFRVINPSSLKLFKCGSNLGYSSVFHETSLHLYLNIMRTFMYLCQHPKQSIYLILSLHVWYEYHLGRSLLFMLASFITTSPWLIVWALESNYISICWREKKERELGPAQAGNSQIYSRSEISELCLAFHPGQTNSNYFYCFHQFGKRYERTSSDIPYCIRQWQYNNKNIRICLRKILSFSTFYLDCM